MISAQNFLIKFPQKSDILNLTNGRLNQLLETKELKNKKFRKLTYWKQRKYEKSEIILKIFTKKVRRLSQTVKYYFSSETIRKLK